MKLIKGSINSLEFSIAEKIFKIITNISDTLSDNVFEETMYEVSVNQLQSSVELLYEDILDPIRSMIIELDSDLFYNGTQEEITQTLNLMLNKLVKAA